MSLKAQVGGVSGSKLNAVNAAPISAHTVEFEPLIETGWSKRRWNDKWQRENLFDSGDSISRFTSMSYRITYGVSDLLETGINITGDFEMISFAAKRLLFDKNQFSLSLLGGYNYVAGNGIYNLNQIRHMHSAIVTGFAATYMPSEKFSLDVDFQFEPGIKRSRTLNDYAHYYINADAGLFVNQDLQLIGGVAFSQILSGEDGKVEHSNLLRLNPGFTLEKGNNFILVGGVPFCIAGRNYECSAGLILALTIMID
jgi:hypothetical protein